MAHGPAVIALPRSDPAASAGPTDATPGADHRSWRAQLIVSAAAAAPIAVAAALVPLRTRVDNTNIALVLVTVVVAVAATGGRLAGACGAVSAAVSFDFFHTRPYESLTINRRADIETAVLLLVVGLIVGELSARSSRHRVDADESGADIARLHAVAEMVSTGTDPEQVIIAVANELRDLLRLRNCAFTRNLANRPRPSLEWDGEVLIAGVRWGVGNMGLPGKEVDLIVHGRGRRLGRFIMTPSPGVPVSWNRRVVAVALADQVGAALMDAGADR
jgi:K+-sensing histidine kinase KdpD